MFDEVSECFKEIIDAGHSGVILTLGKACERLSTKQGNFVQVRLYIKLESYLNATCGNLETRNTENFSSIFSNNFGINSFAHDLGNWQKPKFLN